MVPSAGTSARAGMSAAAVPLASAAFLTCCMLSKSGHVSGGSSLSGLPGSFARSFGRHPFCCQILVALILLFFSHRHRAIIDELLLLLLCSFAYTFGSTLGFSRETFSSTLGIGSGTFGLILLSKSGVR